MVSSKTYTTKKSKAELNSIFDNLQNFAKYHPLIISISDDEKNGYYKVKEKPFKFLPFHIGYSVKPLLSENKTTYLIKGLPLLKPKLSYYFKDNSELLFTIQIKGFIGANQYLAYKMTKAMDQLMLNIDTTN